MGKGLQGPRKGGAAEVEGGLLQRLHLLDISLGLESRPEFGDAAFCSPSLLSQGADSGGQVCPTSSGDPSCGSPLPVAPGTDLGPSGRGPGAGRTAFCRATALAQKLCSSQSGRTWGLAGDLPTTSSCLPLGALGSPTLYLCESWFCFSC